MQHWLLPAELPDQRVVAMERLLANVRRRYALSQSRNRRGGCVRWHCVPQPIVRIGGMRRLVLRQQLRAERLVFVVRVLGDVRQWLALAHTHQANGRDVWRHMRRADRERPMHGQQWLLPDQLRVVGIHGVVRLLGHVRRRHADAHANNEHGSDVWRHVQWHGVRVDCVHAAGVRRAGGRLHGVGMDGVVGVLADVRRDGDQVARAHGDTRCRQRRRAVPVAERVDQLRPRMLPGGVRCDVVGHVVGVLGDVRQRHAHARAQCDHRRGVQRHAMPDAERQRGVRAGRVRHGVPAERVVELEHVLAVVRQRRAAAHAIGRGAAGQWRRVVRRAERDSTVHAGGVHVHRDGVVDLDAVHRFVWRRHDDALAQRDLAGGRLPATHRHHDVLAAAMRARLCTVGVVGVVGVLSVVRRRSSRAHAHRDAGRGRAGQGVPD